MPELPEVQTIVDEMHRQMAGRTIASAILARPDYVRTATPDLAACLVGHRIQAVVREGKRIVIRLNDGAMLVIHLGMSGRGTFESPDALPVRHTHLFLAMKRLKFEFRLRDPRRFGGLWYFPPTDVASARSHGAHSSRLRGETKSSASGGLARSLVRLGPDALAVSARQFATLCGRRRQIKALLLDQTAISGLGNIYCDEALFGAGIHPGSVACLLEKATIERLRREIRRTLNRALRFGGSTLRDYVQADGRRGEFQNHHRVYGCEGRPCPVCNTPIERFMLSGRSTHICPGCQVPAR